MKKLIPILLLLMVVVGARAANPSYANFDTNQFNAPNGGTISITNLGTNATVLGPAFKGTFFGSTYGMVGDAIVLTNVSMTAGSSTISCASAAFKASDVGKAVILYTNYVSVPDGVGTGTNYFQHMPTTIAGFVSGTSVTLSSPSAFTTNSGKMWYGTDNTLPLQAAIKDAYTNGGNLEIASGVFLCNGPLKNTAAQNAVICITNTTSSSPTVVTVNGKGSSVTAMDEFNAFSFPTHGTILLCGTKGTGTFPAFISGNAASGWTDEILALKDLSIILPPNPTLDAVNMFSSGGLLLNNAAVGVDFIGLQNSSDSLIPILTNSCGLRFPAPPSPDFTKIYNSWIWGFGTGVQTSDHMQVYGTSILKNDRGFYVCTASGGAADLKTYGVHIMNNHQGLDSDGNDQGVYMTGVIFEANDYDVARVRGFISHQSPNVKFDPTFNSSYPLKIEDFANHTVQYNAGEHWSNSGPQINIDGQPDPFVTPLAQFVSDNSTAPLSALRVIGSTGNNATAIDFYQSHFAGDAAGHDWLLGEGEYSLTPKGQFFLYDFNNSTYPFVVQTNSPTGAINVKSNLVTIGTNLAVGGFVSNLWNIVTPQMFGAVGDNTNDDAVPLQRCENFIETHHTNGVPYIALAAPQLTFYSSKPIYMSNSASWMGWSHSWLPGRTSTNFVATFRFPNGLGFSQQQSNAFTQIQLRGLSIYCGSNSTSIPAGSVGISLGCYTNTLGNAGQRSQIIDCNLRYCDTGIVSSNVDGLIVMNTSVIDSTNGFYGGLMKPVGNSIGIVQACNFFNFDCETFKNSMTVDGGSWYLSTPDWSIDSPGAGKFNLIATNTARVTFNTPNVEGGNPARCYIDNSYVEIDGAGHMEIGTGITAIVTNGGHFHQTGYTVPAVDSAGTHLLLNQATGTQLFDDYATSENYPMVVSNVLKSTQFPAYTWDQGTSHSLNAKTLELGTISDSDAPLASGWAKIPGKLLWPNANSSQFAAYSYEKQFGGEISLILGSLWGGTPFDNIVYSWDASAHAVKVGINENHVPSVELEVIGNTLISSNLTSSNSVMFMTNGVASLKSNNTQVIDMGGIFWSNGVLFGQTISNSVQRIFKIGPP